MTTNKSDFQQLHYIANKILKNSSIYRSDGVRYSASTESSDRRELAPIRQLADIGAHRYNYFESFSIINKNTVSNSVTTITQPYPTFTQIRLYLVSALFVTGNITLPVILHQFGIAGQLLLPLYFFS